MEQDLWLDWKGMQKYYDIMDLEKFMLARCKRCNLRFTLEGIKGPPHDRGKWSFYVKLLDHLLDHPRED